MSRRGGSVKPVASELFIAGWLPPHAAADALGISVRQLEARARKHEIRRRELAPNTGIFVYETSR